MSLVCEREFFGWLLPCRLGVAARTVAHMNEPLLDVEQAKALLNVTTKWIYQRTYRGELPYLKVGGLLRFRASELDAYLAGCQRGQR